MTCDFQQCGMYDHQSLRSACAYAQTDQSLCWLLLYSMNFKLLTEHHLKFLSLTGGCPGSSESTLVKMTHCWECWETCHGSYLENYYSQELQTWSADRRWSVGYLVNIEMKRNFWMHIVITPPVSSSVPLPVQCISPIFIEVGIPN